MTPSTSPAIQSVLDLFKGPLAKVRFADIDATGLASLAAEVESAAGEVSEQEATLTELRRVLAERQEALLVLAQRALAYARVYAENNDELLEELNRISLPRATKPRKASAKTSATEVATEVAPAADAAEPAAQAGETEAAAPAETAEAPPKRASKKVVRGRLSRAFSREDSA